MTEKRFYLENYKDFTVITLRLYDNETAYWDLDWLTDSHKIVDLLNKFADENKQLKKENNRYQRIFNDKCVCKELDEVYKENEQLKEELADANELKRIYVEFLVDKGFELSDVVEWSRS